MSLLLLLRAYLVPEHCLNIALGKFNLKLYPAGDISLFEHPAEKPLTTKLTSFPKDAEGWGCLLVSTLV